MANPNFRGANPNPEAEDEELTESEIQTIEGLAREYFDGYLILPENGAKFDAWIDKLIPLASKNKVITEFCLEITEAYKTGDHSGVIDLSIILQRVLQRLTSAK